MQSFLPTENSRIRSERINASAEDELCDALENLAVKYEQAVADNVRMRYIYKFYSIMCGTLFSFLPLMVKYEQALADSVFMMASSKQRLDRNAYGGFLDVFLSTAFRPPMDNFFLFSSFD